MPQSQTLLEQANLGKSLDVLTDPSQGGSHSISMSIPTSIKDLFRLKSSKSSQQACTYWGLFSDTEKLDAIGPEVLVPNLTGCRKAWPPKGRLLRRWNDELHARIMGILNADLSRKFIYKKLKKQPGFVCDLWMVGPEAARETAYPTIVAICENRRVAGKIIYVLGRNPQLKDLNLGFALMALKETIAVTAGEVDRLVANKSSETEGLRLCGSQVIASSIPISASSQWVQATIGGVLLLNGIYYGLSVAHAFYPEEDDTSGRSTTDSVSNDIRQDEESADDEEDWDGIFDALCASEALDNNEDVFESSTLAREPCATVVYLPSNRTKLAAHELGSIPPTGDDARDFLDTLALVGHIPQPKWTSCTMDWALIRLHDPRFWGRNFFKSISGEAILTSFVANSPPYGRVMIATRENGPRITQSWGRKCGLSLPGVNRMQEVWCLALSCTKGECGAWVIDPETGCLYGIVVATSEGLDATYILPAHSLLADINERFGGEPGRLENMFPKGELKPWSPDIDEDVIGELGGLEDMSQQDEIESWTSDIEEDAMRQRFHLSRNLRSTSISKSVYTPSLVSQTGSDRSGRYITKDGVRYLQWDDEDVARRLDQLPSERSQARHDQSRRDPRRVQALEGRREERPQVSGAAYTVAASPGDSNQELASTNPQDSTRVQNSPAAPYTLFPRDPVHLATSAPTQGTYPLTSTGGPYRSESNDHAGSGRTKTYLWRQGDEEIEYTVGRGSVSSQRPSDSPRATYGTLKKSGARSLARILSDFTQLPYGDFASCEVFIARNPAVLEEDPNTLAQEALLLQKEGRHVQAKVCVQQSIILRHCQKTSGEERQAFFSGLKRRDRSILGAFLDDLDKVMDVVRRSAPPETQSNNAPLGQARRDTIDNSLPSGMQSMNLGNQNRQDQTNPVQSGSDGQKPTAQYSESRQGLVPRRSSLNTVEEEKTVGMVRAALIEPDIRGTEKDSDNLDPRYIIRHDAKKFFVVGRVFALLWHEKAGPGKSEVESYRSTTIDRFGTRVFSQIRRMAVVKERRGYCVCVPIQTYGGQGVMKAGLDQAERRAHAIIHASDTNPSATSEEQKILVKKPIAVNMASKEQKLDKFSRINFAKPYTVEWNVKVMNVGRVAPTSMTVFESYYRMETYG